MVSLSSFSKLAASAKNALSSRESQTTLKNLETINTAVQKLVATVKAYDGGLLAANAISSDEAQVGIEIKNATADAKKSEVVTDAEADEIIGYILSTLEPSIKASMDALKEKKEKLAASSLQGTVLGDLKELRDASNGLSAALVEKAPPAKHADAEAANKKVDANFEDAIKFFS